MTRPNFNTILPGLKTYASNTGAGAGTTSTSDARVGSETVVGVHRRKPKGWIPPTAYSLTKLNYHRAWGSSEVRTSASSWDRWTGYVGGLGRFNSLNHFTQCLTDVNADAPYSTSAAIVAARMRIKNKKVDLGVAYGERKQTANQLGDTAIRLAESVRELRRGNFRNAARRLGIVNDPGKPRGSNWTNHWLQLQYGWKPLLSDIYGACDALSKREQSDWRVTAKAWRGDTYWNETYYPPYVGNTSTIDNTDSHRMGARRNRGVFVRIDAIPQNDLLMSLSSLGVTNPLLVAWELVPYSFVVDWALPVGNWLDSLDAMLGYGPAWTSVTTFNESTWVGNGVSKIIDKNRYVKNEFVETRRRVKINRTASSGVPLPAFPEFKDPRSLGHMANGLSLLAQVFGR